MARRLTKVASFHWQDINVDYEITISRLMKQRSILRFTLDIKVRIHSHTLRLSSLKFIFRYSVADKMTHRTIEIKFNILNIKL